MQRFCCEPLSNIENYEEAVASPNKWVCHHRLELVATGAVVDSSRQDLIDWDIYWNRPADELIFLSWSEHNKLHQATDSYKNKLSKALKGRTVSEETKHKLSEIAKLRTGEKNPFFGRHHSEETKAKWKGRTPWNKGLKLKSDKCADESLNNKDTHKRG